MAIETETPRSRRALLTAAAGGLGALMAQALSRPVPARAADPNDVILGQNNQSTALTAVTNSAGTGGFQGISAGSGTGLVGASSSGDGVEGLSFTGAGVFGHTNSPSAPAVLGQGAGGGIGVEGFVGTDLPPRDPGIGVSGGGPAIGVRGISTGIHTGVGVEGVSSSGFLGHIGASGVGVHGLSDSANGVLGESRDAHGVAGFSHNLSGGAAGGFFSGKSIGVKGESDGLDGVGVQCVGRTALRAEGAVRFSTATLATIPAGSGSVAVSPGIDLTTDSKVLCTLQADPGGKSISYVSVDPGSDSYSVVLSGRTRGPLLVACFVIS